MRFLCQRKGNAIKCDHVTFSLLPLVLVPYHKLSLNFMILATWIKVSKRLSLYKTIDAIICELNHLGDVGDFFSISALLCWEKLIREGFELFLAASITMPRSVPYILKNSDSCEAFREFLSTVIEYESLAGIFIVYQAKYIPLPLFCSARRRSTERVVDTASREETRTPRKRPSYHPVSNFLPEDNFCLQNYGMFFCRYLFREFFFSSTLACYAPFLFAAMVRAILLILQICVSICALINPFQGGEK